MAARISTTPGRATAPVSEINVTPLVDVMLVLLIVFMVAAPLMAQGVKVDLPQAKADALNEDKPPIAVSFAHDGKAYVGKAAVDATQLLPAIEREASGDRTRRIEIRGDKALAYGRVIEAMGEISAAGYGRIALVSEPPGGQ